MLLWNKRLSVFPCSVVANVSVRLGENQHAYIRDIPILLHVTSNSASNGGRQSPYFRFMFELRRGVVGGRCVLCVCPNLAGAFQARP